MRGGVVLALLCAVAMPAAGQAPQRPPTTQQQFDAAQAAIDARNWPQALSLLDALETRVRNNSRTLALVRVRRGMVLVALDRLEEAAATIRLGLPALPAGDATLTADRYNGLLHLGLIAEHELDYPEALRQYRLAAALPISDADRLLLQRGIVQTQLFTDVEAALRDAEGALGLAAALAPRNRALAGQIQTLKGRALLNLRRYPEAQRALEEAMRLLGNLTARVDRADLLARSDLAIAALLAGHGDDARRYLAFTGAGQFPRGRFVLSQYYMEPLCGPAFAPDDVVVVETIVAEDGSIVDAKPIYASRQGPAAIEAARAVRRWSFSAESLRDIPPLFRTAVRLEIRCRLGPPPARYVEQDDAVLAELAAADPEWSRTLSVWAHRPVAATRAELAALEAPGSPAPRAQLPLLLILASRAQVGKAETEALLQRGLQAASTLSAPPALSAAIALDIARARTPVHPSNRQRRLPDFAAILALPEIRTSPEATALVRLAQARAHYRLREPDPALAIAREIRALPEARPGGRLATEAQEIEVAVHMWRGETAAARAAYEEIGPGAARCGVPPTALPLRTSSSDFPRDAIRWGFEGWAVSEMSIAPDGRVAGTRTVIAYPPFVFGEAAGEISSRARFQLSYTPDGAPCVGDAYTVSFRIPGRSD